MIRLHIPDTSDAWHSISSETSHVNCALGLRKRHYWLYTFYLSSLVSMQFIKSTYFICACILIGALTPWVFLAAAQVPDLGNITLRFCNDTADTNTEDNKTLSLQTNAWKKETLCITLSNANTRDATILLSFVDGTITDDSDQKKACAPSGTTTKFGQYVTIPQDTIVVPAWESVSVTAELTFPEWYSWPVLGCVTSQLADLPTAKTGMFDIQTRKANFIEVLVDGTITSSLEILTQPTTEASNISNSNKITVYKDPVALPNGSFPYKARLQLLNPGNIAQEAVISIALTDLLGKEYTTEQTSLIPAGEQRDVIVPLETLPYYKGQFTITASVIHTPNVEFEIAWIAQEDLAPKTLKETTTFVVIPWELIGGIALILLLLVRITRRKKHANNSTTHS